MTLALLREQLWRFIPAIIMLVIMSFLFKGMENGNSQPEIEQKNMPFPTFSLTDVRDGATITAANLKGSIHIVHVWASWCGVCVNEHDEWLAIKHKFSYPIVGVIYRDEKSKVISILEQKGDPYHYLLDDSKGSLGLGLGLVGTPETYIVDKEGVIRFHQLGAINLQTFEQTMQPLLEKLNNNETI